MSDARIARPEPCPIICGPHLTCNRDKYHCQSMEPRCADCNGDGTRMVITDESLADHDAKVRAAALAEAIAVVSETAIGSHASAFRRRVIAALREAGES